MVFLLFVSIKTLGDWRKHPPLIKTVVVFVVTQLLFFFTHRQKCFLFFFILRIKQNVSIPERIWFIKSHLFDVKQLALVFCVCLCQYQDTFQWKWFSIQWTDDIKGISVNRFDLISVFWNVKHKIFSFLLWCKNYFIVFNFEGHIALHIVNIKRLIMQVICDKRPQLGKVVLVWKTSHYFWMTDFRSQLFSNYCVEHLFGIEFVRFRFFLFIRRFQGGCFGLLA